MMSRPLLSLPLLLRVGGEGRSEAAGSFTETCEWGGEGLPGCSWPRHRSCCRRGKRQALSPGLPRGGPWAPTESCPASFSLWSWSSEITPGPFPPRPVCPGAGVGWTDRGQAAPTPTDAGTSSPKGPASGSVHRPVPPPPPLRLHACVSLSLKSQISPHLFPPSVPRALSTYLSPRMAHLLGASPVYWVHSGQQHRRSF